MKARNPVPSAKPVPKKVPPKKDRTIALAMVLIGRDADGNPIHDQRYQVLRGEMTRQDWTILRHQLADLALRAREDLERI